MAERSESKSHSVYHAVHNEVRAHVGADVFTILSWHPVSSTLKRVYSHDAIDYPVGTEIPLRSETPWRQKVVENQESNLGLVKADVVQVAVDMGLPQSNDWIESSACGCIVNWPVVLNGRTIGVVTAMAGEGRYTGRTTYDLGQLQWLNSEAFSNALKNEQARENIQ